MRIRSTLRATRTAAIAGHAIAHAALGRTPYLRHLLAQGRRVRIAYTADNGETTERTIQPLEVRCSKAGDLYVRAWDMLREAKRSFRLDRITNYQLAA